MVYNTGLQRSTDTQQDERTRERVSQGDMEQSEAAITAAGLRLFLGFDTIGHRTVYPTDLRFKIAALGVCDPPKRCM